MRKFKSKIDKWLLLILLAVSGLLLFAIYQAHWLDAKPWRASDALLYAAAFILIWLPVINTCYILDKDFLIIKCMFFKWTIATKDIIKVSETSNPLSSPALSLQRLKIEYLKNGKHRSVLISPKDKSAFLSQLNLKSRSKSSI